MLRQPLPRRADLRLMETQFEQSARYCFVKSNFEATDAGWAFWRRCRKSNIADFAADLIFDDTSDLVVDTGTMDALVVETRESTAADSHSSGAGSWRRALPSRMEHRDRRSPLRHPRLLPPAPPPRQTRVPTRPPPPKALRPRVRRADATACCESMSEYHSAFRQNHNACGLAHRQDFATDFCDFTCAVFPLTNATR